MIFNCIIFCCCKLVIKFSIDALELFKSILLAIKSSFCRLNKLNCSIAFYLYENILSILD